jgi:hypothetical protein
LFFCLKNKKKVLETQEAKLSSEADKAHESYKQTLADLNAYQKEYETGLKRLLSSLQELDESRSTLMTNLLRIYSDSHIALSKATTQMNDSGAAIVGKINTAYDLEKWVGESSTGLFPEPLVEYEGYEPQFENASADEVPQPSKVGKERTFCFVFVLFFADLFFCCVVGVLKGHGAKGRSYRCGRIARQQRKEFTKTKEFESPFGQQIQGFVCFTKVCIFVSCCASQGVSRKGDAVPSGTASSGSASPGRKSSSADIKDNNKLPVISGPVISGPVKTGAGLATSSGAKSPTAAASVSVPLKQSKPGRRAKALFEFIASDDTEISFAVGDIITIVREDDSGWWDCDKDGELGLAPGNYLEFLPETAPAPAAQAPAAKVVCSLFCFVLVLL